jgi:hypothetical protein
MQGFFYFSIHTNSFLHPQASLSVCLRILLYALLYTLCKTPMQNKNSK